MLKKSTGTKLKKVGGHVAIVASTYNRVYVDSMLKAAVQTLKKGGAGTVEVIRVPGAFEIPAAASALAHRLNPRVSAILCLGVILRGATTHAAHIGESVTLVLAQLQAQRQIPVIHEVLLLENAKQAQERCIDPKRNRGIEAAATALRMIQVLREIG